MHFDGFLNLTTLVIFLTLKWQHYENDDTIVQFVSSLGHNSIIYKDKEIKFQKIFQKDCSGHLVQIWGKIAAPIRFTKTVEITTFGRDLWEADISECQMDLTS